MRSSMVPRQLRSQARRMQVLLPKPVCMITQLPDELLLMIFYQCTPTCLLKVAMSCKALEGLSLRVLYSTNLEEDNGDAILSTVMLPETGSENLDEIRASTIRRCIEDYGMDVDEQQHIILFDWQAEANITMAVCPLHWAVKRGDPALVSFLLRYASPNVWCQHYPWYEYTHEWERHLIADYMGDVLCPLETGVISPLAIALVEGHDDIARLLLEAGALPIVAQTTECATLSLHRTHALQVVAIAAFSTCASLVIEKFYAHIDGHIVNAGTSPLHLAACTYNVKVLTELLEAGAQTERYTVGGYNALHIAMEYTITSATEDDVKQGLEMVQSLLIHGANPNAAILLPGYTNCLAHAFACGGAIWCSIDHRIMSILRLLMSYGADWNSPSGIIPMRATELLVEFVCKTNHLTPTLQALVEEACKTGADFSLPRLNGHSMLILAIHLTKDHGPLRLVQTMIRLGATIYPSEGDRLFHLYINHARVRQYTECLLNASMIKPRRLAKMLLRTIEDNRRVNPLTILGRALRVYKPTPESIRDIVSAVREKGAQKSAQNLVLGDSSPNPALQEQNTEE